MTTPCTYSFRAGPEITEICISACITFFFSDSNLAVELSVFSGDTVHYNIGRIQVSSP